MVDYPWQILYQENYEGFGRWRLSIILIVVFWILVLLSLESKTRNQYEERRFNRIRNHDKIFFYLSFRQ